MNHRPITEDDLHAYVDSALEPERRAEVASYLAEPSIVAGQRHSYAVEVINSLCDCEVVVGLMRALRGYASLGCAESSV